MKVGILTHHWVPNFGANLQALATVSLLKKLGCEPMVIDYRPSELELKYADSISKEQLAMHARFVDEYLPLTGLCRDITDVEKINDRHSFDLLVSGSDAVLRLNPGSARQDIVFPNPFWLTFAKSWQKKIFLAASSMGTNFRSLDRESKNGVRDIVNSSDAVMVRDLWTKKGLLSLGCSPNLVSILVDPVFCLNSVFEIPEKYKFIHDSGRPYFLVSLYKKLVGDDWLSRFELEANNRGYDVLSIDTPEQNTRTLNNQISFPLHPLTWYDCIRKSSGFVGVRFHPVVVSIANGVPFVSYDTYQSSKLFRSSSKTYDVVKRLSDTKYVLGRVRRRILSPIAAIELLLAKRQNKFDLDKVISDYSSVFEAGVS